MSKNELVNDVSAASKEGSIGYFLGLCFIVALGGLLLGFDTAVISDTFDSLRLHFELTSMMEGHFGK